MDELKSREALARSLDDLRCNLIPVEDCPDLKEYTRLPLEKISSMGAAFASLAALVQNVPSASGTQSVLYSTTIPAGCHLGMARDQSGTLGMIFNENNHLVGMARFHPVEGVASQVPFDPFTVCMAASLMAISQKLDAILETQAEILDFLRQKKKADLQGDLKILTEVLNSYQFNWNNEHYRMPALVQVQRIKRASEQSILLSRSQIQRAIQKRGLLTGDKEHRERLRELADLFGDYQLAVYLYSFSAFLEVLLLENFNASYIDSVLAYVESLSLEYRELYTESYDRLMQSASSSVQAQLRGGLAALTGTAGEMVAKIPIISRSQIDETLIDTGRRMGKAAKQKTTKAMEPFIARADSRVRPFLDQLKKIKRIYNENLDLLVDGENLYLRLE